MRKHALQKLFSFFSTKKFSVFGYKVLKHFTNWPLNELVKLTMLWTTGPWCVPRWHVRCNIFLKLISVWAIRKFKANLGYTDDTAFGRLNFVAMQQVNNEIWLLLSITLGTAQSTAWKKQTFKCIPPAYNSNNIHSLNLIIYLWLPVTTIFRCFLYVLTNNCGCIRLVHTKYNRRKK